MIYFANKHVDQVDLRAGFYSINNLGELPESVQLVLSGKSRFITHIEKKTLTPQKHSTKKP